MTCGKKKHGEKKMRIKVVISVLGETAVDPGPDGVRRPMQAKRRSKKIGREKTSPAKAEKSGAPSTDAINESTAPNQRGDSTWR